jgi:murein DD-endopeptidase MepM/ murein hydrolase activator NlpD
LGVLLLGRRAGLGPTPTQPNQGTGGSVSNGSSTTTPTASPNPLATFTPPAVESPPTANSQTSPPSAASLESAASFPDKLTLIIPVAGVRQDQLMDTFSDARSEGRVHDAIDIPAAAGTAVITAADGEIIKLFQSERGGTTIYQLSTDRKFVFYYAHLQSYAAGLAVGNVVKQGEVIAYVGDTGNAGAGNFHLHFSISVVADPKRYWEGTNINPYPLLKR